MLIEYEPMDDAAVARWLPVSMRLYEEDRLRSGDSAAEAAAGRKASEDRFFPDGRLVDGQHLFTILADGEDAGWLWLGPYGAPTGQWWVWDIRVHEPYRRRGIARDAMRFAERVAKEHGAPKLALNVAAANAPAIGLYESLGFDAGAVYMAKPI